MAAGLPIAAVARALGSLREEVVFIGGAIAPLLYSEQALLRTRPTVDVDGMIATSSYTESRRIENALTARGFRRDPADSRHIHRWRSPGGTAFDLVPCGEHVGGTGSAVDVWAIRTAATTLLEPDLLIHHAAAPGFLALKWAAHDDRGRADPRASDDLEDILALLASRPAIVEEIAAAPPELSGFIAVHARVFLEHPDAEDLLAAHLNSAQDPAFTMATVRTLLERLSQL